MERPSGIEPEFRPWQGQVLPLNYGRMERVIGFEPMTNTLEECDSTPELNPQMVPRCGYDPLPRKDLIYSQIAEPISFTSAKYELTGSPEREPN